MSLISLNNNMILYVILYVKICFHRYHVSRISEFDLTIHIKYIQNQISELKFNLFIQIRTNEYSTIQSYPKIV